MKKKKDPRGRVIKELHEWLQNPDNQSFHRDTPRETIMTLLRQPALSNKDKCGVAVNLQTMSTWHLHLAATRIADGPQGWTDLRYATQLYYWHVRILVQHWENDRRRPEQSSVISITAGQTMALALAFEDQTIVDWLGRRLVASLTDGVFGGLDCLPAFMLELYRRYIGQPPAALPPVDPPRPNPYEPVFAAWTEEKALPAAMETLLAFHVAETVDSNDVIGEFSLYPFNIMPVEVWAMQTVRRRQGLPMPQVDHPLLRPPFDAVPPDVPEPQDEWLKSVIQRVT